DLPGHARRAIAPGVRGCRQPLVSPALGGCRIPAPRAYPIEASLLPTAPSSTTTRPPRSGAAHASITPANVRPTRAAARGNRIRTPRRSMLGMPCNREAGPASEPAGEVGTSRGCWNQQGTLEPARKVAEREAHTRVNALRCKRERAYVHRGVNT